MFNRIAPRYDLLNALLSARQDKRWRKRLASLVPYRPKGRFLDVGPDGRRDDRSRQAARRVCFVHGRRHLERDAVDCQQKTKPQKIPAEFRVMSAERLGFSDQTFDAVSISFGLRNVVQRVQALKEFNCAPKQGGTLLILEFFLLQRGPMAMLFQFYFHYVLPTIGGLLSDKQAYKYLPESVGSFYSPERMREVLYETGYTVDSSTNYLFGACRLIKAVKL